MFEEKSRDLVYSINNFYYIKKFEQIVKRSYKFADRVASFSDARIKKEFLSYKNNNPNSKIKKRQLPFLLAIIGEGINRVLNVNPYREQYLCSVAMYYNFICEMKSGEGKSIAAVITSLLNSLTNKVHIVTVNDYLAKRDYLKMKEVFEFFGLSVNVNYRGKSDLSELYSSDVLYTSSTELIFDYLRNELLSEERKINFPLQCVIIDEIDFVLLDNALTVFSVSTGTKYKPNVELYEKVKDICDKLKGIEITKEEYIDESEEFINNKPEISYAHYVYCIATATAYLTQRGLFFLENTFKLQFSNLENLEIYKIILSILEAKLFLVKGRDYVVNNNKVILINRANGRLMINSQLEESLHTALELKENVPITNKPLLHNSLSYQVFFRKYKNMAGMSGTVYDATREFEEIYNIPTIIIPLHRPKRRIDYDNLFFVDKKLKYKFLINFLKTLKPKKQPVLIIASNEEESEHIEQILTNNGIYSNILNNLSPVEEEKVVRAAGKFGNITISTNMSGRGTDIVLDTDAKEAGGLLVISLCRYFSKRIDNQIRGRSGRQGEVGGCIFLISLEDEICIHLKLKETQQFKKVINDTNFSHSNLYNGLINPKYNKKSNNIINKVQKRVQHNLFKYREINYFLDLVVEELRESIVEWKKKLTKDCYKLMMKNLTESIYEKGIMDDDSTKKGDILDLFYQQYKTLGADVADLLLRTIIDSNIENEWLTFKRNMETLKLYLPLHHLSEDNIVAEYRRICSENFLLMKKEILNKIVEQFINTTANEMQYNKEGGALRE